MLLVLYTSFESQMPDEQWNYLLAAMPQFLQEKIVRYVRWQDRHASLLGKLLLRKGFERYGFDPDLINLLNFDRFSRPFLPGAVDFNISHSGRYVVAAFSDEGRVGIDVEKVHQIDVEKFSSFFSPHQWISLENSGMSINAFFEMWTKLESIIKWEGSGVYYDLKKIVLHDGYAEFDERTCQFRKIHFENNYPCHIAAGTDLSSVIIESTSFGDRNEG